MKRECREARSGHKRTKTEPPLRGAPSRIIYEKIFMTSAYFLRRYIARARANAPKIAATVEGSGTCV